MWRLVVVALAVLLVSRPAHAYLDPGSGSMILQGLLAALAALTATVAAFWTRIRRFLPGRGASKQSPGPKDDSPNE